MNIEMRMVRFVMDKFGNLIEIDLPPTVDRPKQPGAIFNRLCRYFLHIRGHRIFCSFSIQGRFPTRNGMFPGRIRLVVSLSRPIRLNAVVGFFCSSRKLNRPFLMHFWNV